MTFEILIKNHKYFNQVLFSYTGFDKEGHDKNKERVVRFCRDLEKEGAVYSVANFSGKALTPEDFGLDSSEFPNWSENQLEL